MGARARLGFVGLGWIGTERLRTLVASEAAEVVAWTDPLPADRAALAVLCPGARQEPDLHALLARDDVDAVVIATPSALHASQAVAALRSGKAVFCQKPLGRTAEEVGLVLRAARQADRLLAVDLSYRHAAAFRAVGDLVAAGRLGRVIALDLVFHNAYGPDKPWFYDRSQSGGGCLVDLGTHLVDLAAWWGGSLGEARGALWAKGRRLGADAKDGPVEDFAQATIELEAGGQARIVCSWHASAGCDAVISADVWGTDGGASVRNVEGSFYNFVAAHHTGTTTRTLCTPPDAWGGRALVDFARRLRTDGRYDVAAEDLLATSRVLDALVAG